jgi:hypothetical protein
MTRAEEPENNPLGIVKAVVRCFKFGPDKQWHPVVGVAYWDEFAPLKEKRNKVDTGETWPNGNPKKFDLVGNGIFTLAHDSKWRTMGRVMLPKCAEAQAIRKGWPEDLSGIYAPEEMERADVIDVTATEVIEEHAKEERLKLVGAKDGIAIWWTPGDRPGNGPFRQDDRRAWPSSPRQRLATAEIQGWARTNRVSLSGFGRNTSRRLGMKTAMEKRLKELATEPREGRRSDGLERTAWVIDTETTGQEAPGGDRVRPCGSGRQARASSRWAIRRLRPLQADQADRARRAGDAPHPAGRPRGLPAGRRRNSTSPWSSSATTSISTGRSLAHPKA